MPGSSCRLDTSRSYPQHPIVTVRDLGATRLCVSNPVPPSQFYTGLVADLYEPLAGEHARAADYTGFLDRSGTPALELCCGAGRPILELRELGYDVEGLDASRDMLELCRAAAAARGVEVALHHAEMQSFSLAKRYRSIFLAGASFTLILDDDDARCALACIHAHLEPGGSAMIPLEIPDPERERRFVGRAREVTGAAGEKLRFEVLALDVADGGRNLVRRTRYERVRPGRAPEVMERVWQTRWWSQQQFSEMLGEAGFSRTSLRSLRGGPAAPADAFFVALAQR
jgi:SAM-dependent methyltransferase